MIKQAQGNFEALIESTQDLIWAVDLDYRLILFNSSVRRNIQDTYGVQLELGMRIQDFLPPERAALWTPYYKRALSEGPFCAEYRLLNGHTLELYFNPIVTDGKTTSISVFGKDITERMAAEESRALLASIVESSDDAIHAVNLDGTITSWNHGAEVLFGYKRNEIIGKSIAVLAPPGRQGEVQQLLKFVAAGNPISPFDTVLRDKGGCDIDVLLSISPIRNAGGEVVGASAIARDITEANEGKIHLAKAQEALRASEEHYRTIFQTSIDGIAISRLDDGKFVEVNQAFLNIVKAERDDIVGRTSTELGVWTDDLIRQEITEVLRRDSYFRNLTVPYRRRNGEVFEVQFSASAIELDGVPCILSIIRDTSEIRAAEERIKDLSYRDPLTHLPNRRMLLERLQNTPGTGANDPHKRALLLINLDDFEKQNDAHGNQIGDLLLQEVGRRLIACVRGADTVARCGGDDFAVLLDDLGEIPEPAASQAKIVAEKIRTALAQPYMLDGHECHSPCSIGITVFGEEPKDAHQIFQQAESAMRRAKAAGRNTTHFFDAALQSAANARAAIEEDLYRAIKANQFLLYYQPQVEEGRLIGVECLIRWNHPTRGLMSPDDFIPLAEETGLILPLGDWVLNAACEQIAAWSRDKQMKDIPIAVNISARQFRQPEFVELAFAALYRTGANPHNLKLELTESMLLENIEEIIAKMTELKSHGLRFSLDDFGIGYSSLSYLKRLPLDQLKIDISFVRDILVDASSGAIAQTIVSLSQVMGLSVIAEGVETEEQRDFLVRLGCRAFQGYLFSRPLPLEEFKKQWLQPTPRRRLRPD